MLLHPTLRFWLLLGSLIFLLPAQAQEKYSLEDIMSSAFPSNLIAHPQKDQLAWVFNQEGSRNIWMAQGPSYTPIALTKYTGDDGQAISNLQFSPDARFLLYVRGAAPNRQGEIPNPALLTESLDRAIWKVSIPSGELQKLAQGSSPQLSPDGKTLVFIKKGQIWRLNLNQPQAEATQLLHTRGSCSAIEWSPQGDKIAFVSSRSGRSFIGIYDFSENTFTYLQPSYERDNNPVWSPDGSQLAFLRFPSQRAIFPFIPHRSAQPWSIMLHELSTNTTQKVWEADEGMGSAFRNISAERQLFWGADQHLAFPWEKDGWTHLYSLSLQDTKARLLTPGNFEVQFVSMSPDGKTLLYSSNQDDSNRQHIWEVSLSGASPQLLSPGKGVEWAPLRNGQGQVACLTSTGTEAAFPALLRDQKLSSLTPLELKKRFPSMKLRAPEPILFSATDGMKIHGQLFLPPDYQPNTKYPAVMFLHGGSRRQMLLGFHHRGYYHHAFAMNHYMASRGYIVLSVNYRSGIGYGMHFREAIHYGADGASEVLDILGAGLYLQNRSDVHPDQIGLWGGSYGGFLTAMGLAQASDLFKAGVDIHGVYDWNNIIQNFVPSYNRLAHPELAERAYESSPAHFVDGWRSPVLLIHGDDDRNVPFSESILLLEDLRQRKVYTEQLVFPDEVHGFLLHTNWLSAYAATADFFDRMLRQDLSKAKK